MSHHRTRMPWTEEEDQLLRDAIEKEDPSNTNPSRWAAVAKHVPNRTNKDCRKRWFTKMTPEFVVKGGWTPAEDAKLTAAVEKYGTKWSIVATAVENRGSDQCAKRWTDTLNPAIDRTAWTFDQDKLLLQAVTEYGNAWSKIVKVYFPGRTGLSAKNRYTCITRPQSNHPLGSRSRSGSDDASLGENRAAGNVVIPTLSPAFWPSNPSPAASTSRFTPPPPPRRTPVYPTPIYNLMHCEPGTPITSTSR